MKKKNYYFNLLKEKISSAGNDIDIFKEALNEVIITGYLDKNDTQKHNELLLPDNPEYEELFYDDLELLEILKDILDSKIFNSFNDFSSLINNITEDDNFNEMYYYIKNKKANDKIAYLEGSKSEEYSKNLKKLLKNILGDIKIYEGKTISELESIIDELEDNFFNNFKNNLSLAYPDFDISKLDNYKENDYLEKFCITMKTFSKIFRSNKKGVKNNGRN